MSWTALAVAGPGPLSGSADNVRDSEAKQVIYHWTPESPPQDLHQGFLKGPWTPSSPLKCLHRDEMGPEGVCALCWLQEVLLGFTEDKGALSWFLVSVWLPNCKFSIKLFQREPLTPWAGARWLPLGVGQPRRAEPLILRFMEQPHWPRHKGAKSKTGVSEACIVFPCFFLLLPTSGLSLSFLASASPTLRISRGLPELLAGSLGSPSSAFLLLGFLCLKPSFTSLGPSHRDGDV